MSNLKTRKEIKENIDESRFKSVEDELVWWDGLIRENPLCIEPFPHRPFYLEIEKELDFSPKVRKKLSYTFFPWSEEIKPEDLEVISKVTILGPGVKESDPVLHCFVSNPEHYSTNPKVWEWDWNKAMERQFTDGQKPWIEIFIYIEGNDIELIKKELKDHGIFYKEVLNPIGLDPHLLLRLGKKGYFKFREFELKLSKEYGIRSDYIYEEIRSTVNDAPVTVTV